VLLSIHLPTVFPKTLSVRSRFTTKQCFPDLPRTRCDFATTQAMAVFCIIMSREKEKIIEVIVCCIEVCAMAVNLVDFLTASRFTVHI